MPIVIDLFCGLGGWSDGLLAEGWDVIGFDVEQHVYGAQRYPAQLVLQDVLTLDGSQFRNADLIVASPPCTEYSYMAQPWRRAKQIGRALIGKSVYEAPLFGLREEEHHTFPDKYHGSVTPEELKVLFDACFRIQREASEAAGRYIPMVVENVKGAQPWVGQAKANYGSFYLWGDLERIGRRIVRSGPVSWGMEAVAASGRHGRKLSGNNSPRMWADREVQRLCDATKNHGNGTWFGQSHGQEYPGQPGNARDKAAKVAGISFSGHGTPGYKPQGFNVTAAQRWRAEQENGVKCTGQKHGEEYAMTRGATGVKNRDQDGYERKHPNALGWKAPRTSSRSDSRKAASVQIAKIPPPLAQHIARIFKPGACAEMGKPL